MIVWMKVQGKGAINFNEVASNIKDTYESTFE